jgi:NAD(P)-dependent dehydrogenase (short-subunit alcohol dehydrogenase family)
MNQNKVILLTGASGGLGTAMSEHLHQSGYSLALHFHDNAPGLEESERVQHFQADLRNVDEIEAMVEAIRGVFGRLDIVINNAGISRNGMSWKLDFEDW